MTWKNQVRQRFSKSADAKKWNDIYTTSNPSIEAISFQQRCQFTIEYILQHFPENSKILDLGCGAGPVISALQNSGYQLTGIDYSFDMLEQARAQPANNSTPLIQADCENIPLISATFDCIICLGVISYAESIKQALSEQYRLLKPGGTVIISYRNKNNEILTDPWILCKHIFANPIHSRSDEPKKIGRSILRQEVFEYIKSQPFAIVKEHQIGFGTIRFNKKVISDGKLATKLNKLTHVLLKAFNLTTLYRELSDIHIIILKKQ